ncbi:MAG TPA: FtsX-like permease family protein, partial [Methanomassiliicoccales archaeon]|nr:FtsX-like permease family protein [Methanomassiliicoccales archaeon]
MAITSHYLAKKVTDQLSGTIGSLQFTAISVTVVAVPLVATVSSMVANERKREIGLLRTMGATRRFVFLTILVEALLLAVIGAIIGAAISAMIVQVFQNVLVTSLSIPFLFPTLGDLLTQVGLIALFAIGIGGLAATYPAIRASRSTPTTPYARVRP